jgi:coatomer subunit beta'
LAETCFKKSKDYTSLLLFYSSYGDESGLKYLHESAKADGKLNIAFECAYLLAQPQECVDILMMSKRYAEAAMFARSYIPTVIPSVMKEWEGLL